MTIPSRSDLMTLDIDIRLADLWREVQKCEEGGTWDIESVACFIRAAYGRGYTDALSEPTRGSLCADHGYSVPVREAP